MSETIECGTMFPEVITTVRPTMSLRIDKRGVLQQAFHIEEEGGPNGYKNRLEWRDIPHEADE